MMTRKAFFKSFAISLAIIAVAKIALCMICPACFSHNCNIKFTFNGIDQSERFNDPFCKFYSKYQSDL